MSTTRVTRIEFAGLRRAFNNLRSADQRSIIAAYRFGEIVDVLHRQGYTYTELGEDVDRSKYTMEIYAKLFNKYADEHELLATAESMRTYNVSRLAGRSALIPLRYQFVCLNCGSGDIRRERKKEDTEVPSAIPIPKFSVGGN